MKSIFTGDMYVNLRRHSLVVKGIATVRFTDCWFAKLNVLDANDDVLVDYVKFDQTAFVVFDFFISTNSDTSDIFSIRARNCHRMEYSRRRMLVGG